MRQPPASTNAHLVSVFLCVCLCVCVCVYVCVCVCLPSRLLKASVMMWHDMDPMCLVQQVLLLLNDNCSLYPLMDMALALIRMVEINPIRVS